jgi:predicted permease
MSWRKRLFSREEIYGDLSDEIQEHLDEKVEELVAAGMSLSDARLAARREFGNVTATVERGREVWQWRLIESFFTDVRFGLRQLRKNPSFTAIAILTLALGIGANATIFSWIRTVLLNPLPGAANPERVVAQEMVAPSGEYFLTSYPDYRDFRDNAKLVESIAATHPMAFAVGSETNVERIWGELVSGNFFNVLRINPEAGRFFSIAEQDDAPNAHPVVVISHQYWASHFHSDRSILGTTIRLNHILFSIVGVAPDAFGGSVAGTKVDLWVPATMLGVLNSESDWMLQDRKTRMFYTLARLAPGASVEQARSEFQAIARRLADAHTDTNQGMSATLLPLSQVRGSIPSQLLAPLGILMAASGVLLLIVCANVANLLLSRATSRQKEFSIRIALGAPRSRLIRQLMTEVLLLTFGGAIFGVVIAFWLSDSLRWLVPTSGIPNLIRPPVDANVLLFTAALAFGVAILAGISPALQAGRENVNETLKDRSRGSGSSNRSRRLGGLLVSAEMALAVLTLIGAGLFVKSFHLARGIHPGFDPNNVAVAHVNFASAGLTPQQADVFSRHLREQLTREPGVSNVSYSDFVPLSIGGDSWEDLKIQDYVPNPGESMKIYRTVVAPGYFDLMKIPILQGRDFDMQDDRRHQPFQPVMIVNQEFVRRFVPTNDPIGRKVYGWGVWFSIVGVVKDIKYFHINEDPIPYFYVPARQIYRPEDGMTFYVRTRASLEQAMIALRREAQAADPTVPVFNVISLNDSIAGSLFGQRIAATLLSVLAGVSLLLASIGLYGVMAYSVAQRTNEIGIRVTLGAQPADILKTVARDALIFSLTGLVIGSAIAVAATRMLSAMLVAVSPTDPVVYLAVTAFTILIAVAATAVPALRALRVDPMVALRYE